jgi:hypothetical protein
MVRFSIALVEVMCSALLGKCFLLFLDVFPGSVAFEIDGSPDSASA